MVSHRHQSPFWARATPVVAGLTGSYLNGPETVVVGGSGTPLMRAFTDLKLPPLSHLPTHMPTVHDPADPWGGMTDGGNK